MNKITTDVIPVHLLQWLAESRIFLDDLKNGKPLRYFSAHLPVMATWNKDNLFPVNLTVKGIGLIPKDELIMDFIDLFEGIIAESRTMPWHKSLSRRIEAMNVLYKNIYNFNPSVLGGLEIFVGKAFENLKSNPHASLLYVGMMPTTEGIRYISFQVNGKVELLKEDNLYYRFLLASRKLFEFDKFHLYQPSYPFGYLIKVVEVLDKTPKTKFK
ncbi:MAG: hypothetical protein GXO99_09380 [Nitrospirae bacterium]|nr:hypothetical protein [Nitrospirota bacterium]